MADIRETTAQSPRILIFGNSGSGKSTLAKVLAERHQLVHLDLDSIVWEPGKIAVQRDPSAIEESLRQFLDATPGWVMEGCYGELIEAASGHCSLLLFLNPGIEACQDNNRRRPWEPHKYASQEKQDAMLDALQSWVAQYETRNDSWSYSAHRRIFSAHPGRKLELTDRVSADAIVPV